MKAGLIDNSMHEQPMNSALPTPQNYSYLMSQKTHLGSSEGGVLSDQEGNQTYK